jgi:7,8-dihydropterin-6-yl-methyl-4-(beta-D-ribofuranosyl)aminobenzene 5'-phosphate synthase
LSNRLRNQYEDTAIVSQVGEYLKNTGLKYYTCHCTGLKPYQTLKEIMGENIEYLATGSQLKI